MKFSLIDVKQLQAIVEKEKDNFGASLFNQANLKRIILPQSKKTIVIAPDRKLLVEDVSGKEPSESDLITKYLPKAQKVLATAAFQPVAYGFNYSVVVEGASKTVSNPKLEKLFSQHDILGVGGRIIYTNKKDSGNDNKHGKLVGDAQLDLRYEPNIHNKKQYIIRLNVHYKTPKSVIPLEDDLNKQFKAHWKHLSNVTEEIFG